MGCQELGEISNEENTSLSEFSGQKLAVDAAFWFERYYYARVTQELSDGEQTVNGSDISQSIALLMSLPDLFRHNITPVFVFDPMRRSRSSKAETDVPYLQNTPDTSEPEKHSPFLQRPTELLLTYLDVPFCEAPLYAEADASVFAYSGRVDAVVSNDYDSLLYGSPVMIRKLPGSSWEKIKLQPTLEQNNLNRRELLDVAILVGTDEAQGPYKSHIKEAVTKIKQASDLDEFESEHNQLLRGPSLRVEVPSPTFQQLHYHYQKPPVTSYPARPEPSYPDPDFGSAGHFLYEYFNKKPEEITSLLDPIRKAIY